VIYQNVIHVNRVPRLLESHGFVIENSSIQKVLEKHFGPEKYWKLKLNVLESRGKIS